jgi:hypothetical protein
MLGGTRLGLAVALAVGRAAILGALAGPILRALVWPGLLTLLDRTQRITGPRDPRQIDLRPLIIGHTCAAAAPVAPSGQCATHTFGLVSLQRARMRLLLRHTDGRQHVEDRLALDFQFPC